MWNIHTQFHTNPSNLGHEMVQIKPTHIQIIFFSILHRFCPVYLFLVADYVTHRLYIASNCFLFINILINYGQSWGQSIRQIKLHVTILLLCWIVGDLRSFFSLVCFVGSLWIRKAMRNTANKGKYLLFNIWFSAKQILFVHIKHLTE